MLGENDPWRLVAERHHARGASASPSAGAAISVTSASRTISSIGVSIDRSAGTALITDNLISGAKDGAIRAMNGPTPTGPYLARASAEAFPNLAIYSTVAR